MSHTRHCNEARTGDGRHDLCRCDPVVAELRAERDELLRVVEAVASAEPQGVIGGGYYGELETGCRFCDEEDYGAAQLKHADGCPWLLARKLVGTTT